MTTRRSSNVNAEVAINVAGTSRRFSVTDDKGLTNEELEEQESEELPDREQMSLVNANIAAPVNAAVALNALSDNSTAIANATQSADIHQGN
jgi:hypothetical protein